MCVEVSLYARLCRKSLHGRHWAVFFEWWGAGELHRPASPGRDTVGDGYRKQSEVWQSEMTMILGSWEVSILVKKELNQAREPERDVMIWSTGLERREAWLIPGWRGGGGPEAGLFNDDSISWGWIIDLVSGGDWELGLIGSCQGNLIATSITRNLITIVKKNCTKGFGLYRWKLTSASANPLAGFYCPLSWGLAEAVSNWLKFDCWCKPNDFMTG